MMQQTLAAPGGLFRTFIRYVSRNVLSMLGLSLYIFADTYFISGGVGNKRDCGAEPGAADVQFYERRGPHAGRGRRRTLCD